LKLLLKQKKVIASVRESLDKIGIEDYQFPKDILNELRKNKTAWKNFQKFPEPYKRIRVAFIDGSRKRPDEFTKRLDYLIKMTEANKKFGLRGNEKYY
jgi:predicted DNA-binding protein